jgi:hypothetical protein
MADSRAIPSILLLVIALLLAANLFRNQGEPSRSSRSAPLPTRRLEQVTERLAAAVEKLDIVLARTPEPNVVEERPGPVIVHTTPAPSAGPLPAADQIPPKNDRRIKELRPSEVESSEILRAYAFRTYSDILAEFGFPDDIWIQTNGVSFNYEFPTPDGYTRNLTFAFVGGIVVGIHN